MTVAELIPHNDTVKVGDLKKFLASVPDNYEVWVGDQSNWSGLLMQGRINHGAELLDLIGD